MNLHIVFAAASLLLSQAAWAAENRLGLPHEAMPVSKLESGAIRFLAFDVRFTPESGHQFSNVSSALSASSDPIERASDHFLSGLIGTPARRLLNAHPAPRRVLNDPT